MLDRSTPPPIRTLPTPEWIPPHRQSLTPHTQLFSLQDPASPVFQLDIISQCHKSCAASNVRWLAAHLLTKGTKKHTAAQVAQYFAQYGASFNAHVHADHVRFSLHVLAKHIDKVLPLVAELLYAPAFRQEDLDLLKAQRISALALRDADSERLAMAKFRQAFFGNTHAYGHFTTAEEVNSVSTQALRSYHIAQLLPYCQFFIGGGWKNKDIQLFKTLLSHLPAKPLLSAQAITPQPPTTTHVEKSSSLQTSIVAGLPVCKPQHADYIPLRIACTLLGGYFGARLMQNLREDKGYTYGIYSRIAVLQQAQYLYIAASVKQAHRQESITEIHKEMVRLQQEEVPQEELSVLTAYLQGQLWSGLDTVFARMQYYMTLWRCGLPDTYLKEFYTTLQHIETATLQRIAQQYFVPAQLTTVTVG